MSTKITEETEVRPTVNMFAVGLAVVMGAILAGVSALIGNYVGAAIFLAILWGFAGVLVIGPRFSDTVALIGDDVNDERHVYIHQRAALYSLNLLMFFVVVAFIVDVARGGTGAPYSYMGAIGAVTYFSFLIALSRRT